MPRVRVGRRPGASRSPVTSTANVATAVSLVARAADQGARVVVLPELFLTGYDPARVVARRSLTLDPDDRLGPARADAAPRAPALGGRGRRRRRTSRARRVHAVGAGGRRRGRAYRAVRQAAPLRAGAAASSPPATTAPRSWSTAGTSGSASATTAASPSTRWRPPPTARSAYLSRRPTTSAPSTGATSTTPPGPSTTASTWSSPGSTGTCGDEAFSGGTAVYDPEGRPLRPARRRVAGAGRRRPRPRRGPAGCEHDQPDGCATGVPSLGAPGVRRGRS